MKNNRIIKRIAKGTMTYKTTKEQEIKHFTTFYNSCELGSYIRGILDNAGINPDSVRRAVESDFDFIS